MTDYRTLDSEWNFALAYFKRLDNLCILCNLAQANGNFVKWFDIICVLHKELKPQMKPEEKEKIQKLRDRCIVLIKNAPRVEKYTFNDNLEALEDELRFIMKERGMDMPRKSDPSRALLNQ
jgi:hypothetical protein